MEFLIRRRSVVLTPPGAEDLAWIFAEFNERDTWWGFGYDGPSAPTAIAAYFASRVVVMVIRTRDELHRIGFVVLFGPQKEDGDWEFGYAIPDPRDRNAFAAIAAVDAACHYIFEHRTNVPALRWRIVSGNRAAAAVVGRLGYAECDDPHAITGEGVKLYRGSRADWQARKKRLGEGPHFECARTAAPNVPRTLDELRGGQPEISCALP
jgi:RimJ/RimL family protein N-acetyltransferase